MVRMLFVAGLVGMGLACSTDGGPPPPAPPPATPPPTPRPAPLSETLNPADCEASLPHGTAVGAWTADLGRGNRLELRAFRTETVDAKPEHPEPGTELVAWGALYVRDLQSLLDVKASGSITDPGAMCVASLGSDGLPKPGTVRAEERTSSVLDMVLVGDLQSGIAPGVVAGLAEQAWIPWDDDVPGERPYVHLRLGGDAQHGFPTALGRNKRLTGDIVVALVDGKGKALVHTARAR